MNVNKYTKTWQNVSSKDVVEAIAKRYGYSTEIEKFEFRKRDSIGQSHQTDIEFLEQLASNEYEPFICKVSTVVKDDKEITVIKYIRKRVDKDAVAGFCYRTKPYDIISFNPQLNREIKRQRIEESNITTNTKSVVTDTATSSDTSRSNEGGVAFSNDTFNPVVDTKK